MSSRDARISLRLALLGGAILAYLLLSGCASMVPEEKWALGLAVADVATTAVALDRGHDEGNPLLAFDDASDSEVIVRAVVLNVALHLLLRHWLSNPERGHDRNGWRVVIGVRAAPVLWNANQILEGAD